MKQREVIGITVRLTKVLGKGAFGEVFLAQPLPSALGHGEDVDYPPFFALKIIPLRLCGKSTLTEIEREMTAVERFHHPHIVSAVDKWLETGPSQYKGSFCLAMTLCNGGDLGMYINKQRARGFPLSVDFVARVMVHILSALNYSHSKGVIHRDIKPTNVFIVNETPPTRGEDGEVIPKVVVGDFGLSRPLEHSSEMAKTRVGTPGYLSPEIIQSKPYNFKTDIFSAGVLFYELMTLEKPFWKPHYTNGNIFWCTIATDPVPNLIKTCKDWAGHSLCEMVSRMLSKDPIQRPTAYEALTQYSSRLKSIVADELILTIPDYQFFTSPCSQLAIQEHKSLVGPELLIKPSLSDSLKEENLELVLHPIQTKWRKEFLFLRPECRRPIKFCPPLVVVLSQKTFHPFSQRSLLLTFTPILSKVVNQKLFLENPWQTLHQCEMLPDSVLLSRTKGKKRRRAIKRKKSKKMRTTRWTPLRKVQNDCGS